MKGKDSLINVFTGDELTVMRIKAELENEGIKSFTEDGFKQGLVAGFGGGIPSAIDLFVVESDAEKASDIIKSIID